MPYYLAPERHRVLTEYFWAFFADLGIESGRHSLAAGVPLAAGEITAARGTPAAATVPPSRHWSGQPQATRTQNWSSPLRSI
ncbi:hypothetical protein [Zavarzinella formosa]|uniref:hypothetical protein n=1 Tax=Zavarzinella formosa TaxID=360055 RepID=UPI000381D580|nr:hypothetical protein [Zavarzinella formosa]